MSESVGKESEEKKEDSSKTFSSIKSVEGGKVQEKPPTPEDEEEKTLSSVKSEK